MPLQRRTIQKLLREDFPGTNPLRVAAAEREKVGADLKARLERLDGVDTKETYGFAREEEKLRHVCSVSLIDPNAHYHYYSRVGFRLLLDDAGRLTIQAG